MDMIILYINIPAFVCCSLERKHVLRWVGVVLNPRAVDTSKKGETFILNKSSFLVQLSGRGGGVYCYNDV